jgi:hypothetical protein
MKICPVGDQLFHADRWTEHMTVLILAFYSVLQIHLTSQAASGNSVILNMPTILSGYKKKKNYKLATVNYLHFQLP